MALILTDVGTTAYNGYTFDGASEVRIRCEPVQDDAQRTVIYHRYVVSVKTIIADAGANGTDLTLASIRALLTKQGQALTVTGKGFEDLIVNTGGVGSVNDVAFGPKPRIVAWRPIGSLYACEVEWECEACIAFCGEAKSHSGLLAFNYELTYALDHRGLTVRTITGYLEIAMTRATAAGGAIPDTADAYRTSVSPVIPLGFHRTSQSYSLSNDKRRLNFSIIDTELPSPNPWPLGVVSVDARHRVGWSRRGGMAARLRNSINVEVELAPNQPLLNGYAVFWTIAKTRLDWANVYYGNAVLIESLDADEQIFDRRCSFSLVYTVCKSLHSLLTSTGLWQPLGANTWAQWATSLDDIRDQRGYSNMRHLPANDVILDPCAGAASSLEDYRLSEATQAERTRGVLENDTPPAADSWLHYDSHVHIDRDRALVRQAIMQTPDAEDDVYSQNATGNPSWTQGGTDDILQRSGRSRHVAILKGRAVRAGHPIPRPALQQVGSATAKEIRGDYDMVIVGNWLGVPIYAARWEIEYALENGPSAVKPIGNVEQGVDEDGNASSPDNI